METLSYNEEKHKNLGLKHIFFPETYGFISEVIIVVISLIVFNANNLSNRLLINSLDDNNPFSFSLRFLDQSWTNVQQVQIVQQVLTFTLWAVAGMLIYVLIFRSLQIIFGVKSSIGTGIRLVHSGNYRGYMRWLVSLHDFFAKSLVKIAGFAALVIGAFVCFGIASRELRAGLIYSFPDNLLSFLLCFISAVVSIRLIVIGMSLLFVRFRHWYAS